MKKMNTSYLKELWPIIRGFFLLILIIVINSPSSGQFYSSSDYQHSNAMDEEGNRCLLNSQDFLNSEGKSYSTKGDEWNCVGPYGGDVEDFDFCSEDPSIIYAIASSPFKSTDGGEHWQIMGEIAEYGNSFNCVCSAPGGKVFIGGTSLNGKIALSEDYGETWSFLDLPPNSTGSQKSSVYEIVLDPVNSDIIYLGTSVAYGNTVSEVLYKSTDGGYSYEILNTDGAIDPALPVQNISIDPLNPDIICAVGSGGTGGGGIIMSTDGGDSWYDCSNGLNTAYVFNACCVYDGIVYMSGGQLYGGQDVGVYKSSDLGGSWENISASFPVKAINDVIVNPDNPSIILAASEGDGIYISEDGGNTWTYTTSGADNYSCRDLKYYPGNTQKVYAGFLSMAIGISEDGGESWIVSNEGMGALKVIDIAFCPVDYDMMLISFEAQNSGGCYYSNDGGTTYTLAEGLPATRYSAVAIDPNGIMYACSDGPSSVAPEGLYKSEDGGLTWIHKGPDMGPNFETEINDIAISEQNPDFILIGGNNYGSYGHEGVIYKSTNAGDDWVNVYTSPVDFYIFNKLDMASVTGNQTIYAAAYTYEENAAKGFMKSEDGGDTWFDIVGGLPSGLNKAGSIVSNPQDPNHLIGIAGAFETYFSVYESDDGGENWTDLNFHTQAYKPFISLAVNPQNPGVMCVATNDGLYPVYLSVNNGQSWIEWRDGLPRTTISTFSDVIERNGTLEVYAVTFNSSTYKIDLPSPQYVTVEGGVEDIDNQEAIEGAEIAFSGQWADYVVYSDNQGHFEIGDFVTGLYDISVSAEGFNDWFAENIEIVEPSSLEIELTSPTIAADVNLLNGLVSPGGLDSMAMHVNNEGSGPLEWHASIQHNNTPGEVLIAKTNLFSQIPEGCSFFGSAFDGEFIWVVCTGAESGFNHFLCKFDTDGILQATYDQNIDVWGLRGICYHEDGYLYGGSNVGFHRIDPADGSVSLLFEERFGLSCLRGLTYVPGLGFIAKDYTSEFVIFDLEGNLLGTMPSPEDIGNVSGITYDSYNDCLWLYARSGSASTTFYQYSLDTQELTDVVIDIPMFEMMNSQQAGGVFFSDTFIQGEAVLLATTNHGDPIDYFYAVELSKTWVNLDTCYGLVNPGESQEVNVIFDGYGLDDGDLLDANLVLKSRNPNVGSLEIPVSLQVQNGVGIKENLIGSLEVLPSPFINQFEIDIDLLSAEKVQILLYDINGKLVSEIYNGYLKAGQHKFEWNDESKRNTLNAGIYMLMINSQSQHFPYKLVKID